MIVDGNCTGAASSGSGGGGGGGGGSSLLSGLTGGSAWSHVGGNYSATKVSITYQIDPFSSDGQAWILLMRASLSTHMTASLADSWHVGGEGPIQMDVADKTFGRFPLMIGKWFILYIL